MTEFIFYTDEGSTVSPNGTELENLQILGIEKGESRENVLEKFIQNNVWIGEAGFDVKRIFVRQLVKS